MGPHKGHTVSRPGIRPHTWKVQGFVAHEQYRAWQRAKAQANFRKEGWHITFEQWQQIWQGQWENRGRSCDSVCMTRQDRSQPWTYDNVKIITRLEHYKQQHNERMPT